MIKVVLFVLLILGLSSCSDSKKAYEDAKVKAAEVKDSAVKQYEESKTKVVEQYETTIVQAAEVKDSAVKKYDDTVQSVSDYQDKIIAEVTESIKAWIYKTLEPVFPWMFLVLFLVLFGALKMIIPFSNYTAIQIPIFLGSYGLIFSMFYILDIAIFALEATFWFLLPIVTVSLIIFFFRKTLLPKIKALIGISEPKAETVYAETVRSN